MSDNTPKTYFDILGIGVTTRDEVIHQAYLRMKAQAQGDTPWLRQIEEAYRTLANPISRQKYMERLKSAGTSDPQAPGVKKPSPNSAGMGGQPTQNPPQGKVTRNRTEVFNIDSLSPQTENRSPAGDPTVKKPGAEESGKPEKRQRRGTEIFDASDLAAPVSGENPGGFKKEENHAAPPNSEGKVSRRGTVVFESPAKPEPQPQKPPDAPSNNPGKATRRGTEIFESPTIPDPRPQKPPETPANNSKSTHRGTDPLESPLIPVPQPQKPPEAPANNSKATRRGTDPLESPLIPAPQPQKPPEDSPQTRREAAPVAVPVTPAPEVVPPAPLPPALPVIAHDVTMEHVHVPAYKLEVVFEGVKEVFSLLPGENLIGRIPKDGPPPQIVINDKFTSRRHAQLINEGQQFFVIDLASKNGTRLNGSKIEPNKRIPIKLGDELEIENRKLRLIEE